MIKYILNFYDNAGIIEPKSHSNAAKYNGICNQQVFGRVRDIEAASMLDMSPGQQLAAFCHYNCGLMSSSVSGGLPHLKGVETLANIFANKHR